MKLVRKTPSVAVLAMALLLITGCGAPDYGTSTVGDELGWQKVRLVLINRGIDTSPVLDQGKCYVFIAMPTEEELHVNLPPTLDQTFYHIGRSIEECLAGTARIGGLLSLNIGAVLVDQLVNIDYASSPGECGVGNDHVLGCFLSGSSLVALNDTVIGDLISTDYPYTLWSRHVIGHEVWHAYDPYFHATYYLVAPEF